MGKLDKWVARNQRWNRQLAQIGEIRSALKCSFETCFPVGSAVMVNRGDNTYVAGMVRGHQIDDDVALIAVGLTDEAVELVRAARIFKVFSGPQGNLIYPTPGLVMSAKEHGEYADERRRLLKGGAS